MNRRALSVIALLLMVLAGFPPSSAQVVKSSRGGIRPKNATQARRKSPGSPRSAGPAWPSPPGHTCPDIRATLFLGMGWTALSGLLDLWGLPPGADAPGFMPTPLRGLGLKPTHPERPAGSC